ncbi:MAG: hypothetical protein JSS96_13050 [Bacteroidetes bacterium]|nr:hypothetical protein [Bacteroidota bacterium]
MCGAQDYKFDFGLSAPLYFRTAHAHEKLSNNWNLFGLIGLDGVLCVKGAEPGSMSFVLNAGITDDIRKFSVDYSTKLKTSLYFININPSVIIPSRWDHIRFCLGIGALIQTGQKVALSRETVSGGYSNVPDVDSVLKANGRGIMPFMSLGISDDIGKHMRLELRVQPTLLNLYEPNTDMVFNYGNQYRSSSSILHLNYQPVYVGLKLFYFFKGNEQGM